MSKILRRTQFGNPILRQQARKLSKSEILSSEIQQIISDMFYTLKEKRYGVALAAPQVGHDISLTVINIRPTRIRPNLPKDKWAKLAVINPEVTKTYGKLSQLWEGCISFSNVFAKVPRYKKIKLKYFDERAIQHEKIFDGLLAHVLQHETDHLRGLLFVERVKDASTFMSESEYRKRIVKTEKHKNL